jgi:hypothetical protein
VSGEKRNEPERYEPINHGEVPKPAARLAASILKNARANFAIIGRVAMWTYLPPEQQEFTKDLDLAVSTEHIAAVVAEVRRRKLKYHQRSIGGIGVRDGERKIDFIDRRLYHAALFREAIEAALRDGRVVSVGRVKMPLVSAEYLVAMKMVSGESKDDRDAKRLLEHVKLNYAATRRIVRKHLGPVTATASTSSPARPAARRCRGGESTSRRSRNKWLKLNGEPI